TPNLKILTALRLGQNKEGKFLPNIACAILLAKDPVKIIPGCKIHFLRFEGTEEKTGQEYNETANMPFIEGPLPHQIDKMDKVLNSRIRKLQTLDEDGKFNLKPEYPRAAWYEAIVNACVHRSYNYRNRKIFVRMFDDRLEFESPGPFPPGVTPENIYDVQHSRNPYLMESMRYLGYAREVGEGTPRIRNEMQRSNLPSPEFLQPELVAGVSVLVKLRNRKADYSNKVGEPEPKKGELADKRGDLAGKRGELTANSGTPAQMNKETPEDFSELPEEVAERLPVLGGKGKPQEMRHAILELCSWRPLMIQELAIYLSRSSTKSLLARYIAPMVEEGLLQRTIPNTPNHPAQRYSTTSKGEASLL
ncbi:MAG: hypothetical protein KJT03_20540, partial [Verrucomicrobiae bacterium]|nr:hypothetical protein [Verrucomicrobiae bacterium]